MPYQALLLQLVRHLGCYLQLGAAAAVEYRSTWLRRALLILIAVVAGTAGLAALWIAGLVALWETPWRLTYVIVSAVAVIIVSAVALYLVLAKASAGPAADLLGTELRKDMELFLQWKSTL
jgi:hypothetical protein